MNKTLLESLKHEQEAILEQEKRSLDQIWEERLGILGM